jgi:hypothetical protein
MKFEALVCTTNDHVSHSSFLSNFFNSLSNLLNSDSLLSSLSSDSRHNEGNTSQAVRDCSSKLKFGQSSSGVGKTSIWKTSMRKTSIRKTSIRIASKWQTSICDSWGSSNFSSRGLFLRSRSSCYNSRSSKSISIRISTKT